MEFVKIPGISGEATDKEHVGWIAAFGTKFQGDPASPGPGELTFKKRLDKASAALADALLNRTLFESVLIDVVVGTNQTRRIPLRDARVSMINRHDPGDPQPYEEVTLAFAHRMPDPKSEPDPRDDNQLRPESTLPPMARTAFLQVPGIPGDEKKPPHVGWIGLYAVGELRPERTARIVQEHDGSNRRPTILHTPDSEQGTIAVTKGLDSATPTLSAALAANTEFEWIMIDADGTGARTIRLERASILSIKNIRPPGSTGASRVAAREEVTFRYERSKREQAPKPAGKPATHPIVRAHAAAMTERSTINLRPPKFFELALPVLNGDDGQRLYPPASAMLRLTSTKGYETTRPISDGMITADQYCSFRYYDIAEKSTDELFTATLESAGQKETIFKDRPVATYIRAARKTGSYETAFSPGRDAPIGQQHDEQLAPLNQADGQAEQVGAPQNDSR